MVFYSLCIQRIPTCSLETIFEKIDSVTTLDNVVHQNPVISDQRQCTKPTLHVTSIYFPQHLPKKAIEFLLTIFLHKEGTPLQQVLQQLQPRTHLLRRRHRPLRTHHPEHLPRALRLHVQQFHHPAHQDRPILRRHSRDAQQHERCMS